MLRLNYNSILLIVACLYFLDLGRGERCDETTSRTTVSYTSCGFLWLSTCSSYRTVYYKDSKCCLLWTGPSCDVPICGELSISNGDVSIASGEDQMIATYSCDLHYQLTGGDSVRSCTPDGDWDGTAPSCAYMNSCSSSPCLHNGDCTNGPDTYTCKCPRAWSGTRCEKNIVDCGFPGNIEDGKVTVSGTKYGDTATYTCNEHFNMTSGDPTATCRMDFSWTGTKPTCTFVNTCISNPCQNEGTCVNGLNMYTCYCKEGWSGINCEQDIQPPVMEKCPENIHKNATERTLVVTWTPPSFNDSFGTAIDITANYPEPEFEFPWGDFTVQYVATKINNGLSVECVFNISVRPTPCEDLNIPMNGARVCNGWQTDYGCVCLLACKENFTIPPIQSYQQLYVCGASGNWISAGPLPDCSVPVESEDEALIYHPEAISPWFPSCDVHITMDPIKQHYIDVLKQSGELASYCHKYPEECHADNVAVDCE